MASLIIRIREEKGISAVIVAICLVGLFGAAVLAIDAGSAWATRRKIVTGTDAAALAAARYFSQGLADPCTSAGQTLAENEASAVLHVNSPDAEHVAAPTGYEVLVSGCPSNPVGHVRYDARLGAQRGFAGIFGFGQTKPYSSSTAEFGYNITPVGLRPIAVCDQSNVSWGTNQATLSPPGTPGTNNVSGTPLYPHYALYNWLMSKPPSSPGLSPFTQPEYDNYFGKLDSDYPSTSVPAPNNGNGGSINASQAYLTLAQGGGVVHRVNAKDDCQGGASWRGWVDLNGQSNGSGDVEDWLKDGFDGSVSVGDSSASPPIAKDCNSSKGDQYCEIDTGNHNSSGIRDALNSITCDYRTQSKDCFTFPIIVDSTVTGSPQARVQQVAFLYVILRGWGDLDTNDNSPCNGNNGCVFDFEFVNVQGQGVVGHNPSTTNVSPRVTDLCGIDHDTQSNRCNV